MSEERIFSGNTVEEVAKAFAETVSMIIKQPQENKKFFKKWWIFISKDVISITRSSGFYEGLLPGKDVERTVSVNVEYLINKRSLVIRKKIYSQFASL